MKTKVFVSLFLVLVIGLFFWLSTLGGTMQVSRWAKAARAQLAGGNVITIYPTGIAAGEGNDTDTILAAIEQANDGDVILLKAANLKKKPTPWLLRRPHNGEDVDIVGPTQTTKYYQDLWFGFPRSKFRNIGVSKGITLRGEVGSDGAPMTVIKNFETREKWVYYRDFATGVNEDVNFVVSGGKHPKFENLHFKWIWQPLFAFAPYDAINCKFEGCMEPVACIDDRWTFPHLMADPNDFSDMVVTNIKDCVFRDCTTAFYFLGSGILVEGCDFGEFTNDIPGQKDNLGFNSIWDYGVSFNTWATIWIEAAPGIDPAKLPTQQQYSLRNVIRNNRIDGIGAPRMLGISHHVFGGVARNNEVYGNKISNLAGFGFDIYAPSGISKNDSVSNNIFTRCELPIIINGSRPPVSNFPLENTVTENTFIDLVNAPQSGFLYFFSPTAVLLYNTQQNKVFNNDFTQSGLPGWASGTGCVLIDAHAIKNTVTETKFPAGTGICEQILGMQGNIVSGYNPGMCNMDPARISQIYDRLSASMAKMQSLKLKAWGRK